MTLQNERLVNKNSLALFQQQIQALQKQRPTLNESPSPIWQPFPNSPQERAYQCQADIIGFGGAAGGGKTFLALGKAFTQFYNSIIFRRIYKQLDGVIASGDEIQNGACRYIAGDKQRWLTPDGRAIRLGGIEHEHNKNDYKGRARDFIAFDEAAEFTESMVRFVIGWLRTDRTDIHPQVLLTFNPPTAPEGEWIVHYFAPWIDPDYPGQRALDGEWRYFCRIQDTDVEVPTDEPYIHEGITYHPQSRTFFAAKVEDNPVYMATGYDKHLETLPEPLRSQLRWGDFAIAAKDDIWQAIPTAWIIEAQNRWIQQGKPDVALRRVSVDPSRGGEDETVIAKLYGTYLEIICHPGVDVLDGVIGARYVTEAMGSENAPVDVDVIGYGASVYDHLKVLEGIEAHPVNVGAASTATDKTGRYRFFNLRSQIVWQFREALDPASDEQIALPPNVQLRNDLKAPRYQIVGGKIKIEDKKAIKERIGRSPDKGDAVLLVWFGAGHAGLSAEDIERWRTNTIDRTQ